MLALAYPDERLGMFQTDGGQKVRAILCVVLTRMKSRPALIWSRCSSVPLRFQPGGFRSVHPPHVTPPVGEQLLLAAPVADLTA